ncbi:hypothetical protein HOY82DRAFT_177477 [Tuber indicum]|nr:hypothetical protein HOY82DRAFT_177477 [Tuber indicum]
MSTPPSISLTPATTTTATTTPPPPLPDDTDSDLATPPSTPPPPPLSSASTSSSSTATTASSPNPVFAPRPLRLPQFRHPRPLLLLDQFPLPLPRTPSPLTSPAPPACIPSSSSSSPKLARSFLASSPSPPAVGGGGELGRDVLEELFKIIRSVPGSPPAGAGPGAVGLQVHRRQGSAGGRGSPAAAAGGRECGFPSSPVSRTTMRNPIIFNSQFDGEST